MLFGSYARGGWVEDRKSGYRSDYDLLVVVNNKTAESATAGKSPPSVSYGS